MQRRSFLKGALSAPLVAALPVAAGAITPEISMFTPNPAVEPAWRVFEVANFSGGGGKGGGPLLKTFNYYAVHSERDVAVSLADYGNVMPEEHVLEAAIEAAKAVPLESDYRARHDEYLRYRRSLQS